MRKGLGMWIMSKLVIVIFLFALLFVLTGFLRVYEEKVIADTARDNTALLAEVGNTALSFQAAGGMFYLEPLVVVENQYQQYTVFVETVGSGDNDRVVFLLAWKLQDSLESVRASGGFASSSALDMPPEVRIDSGAGAGRIWFFKGQAKGGFELVRRGDPLLVQPSLTAGENDEYLLFYRNKNVFCVGTMVKGLDVKEQMGYLSKCCVKDSSDMGAECGA